MRLGNKWQNVYNSSQPETNETLNNVRRMSHEIISLCNERRYKVVTRINQIIMLSPVQHTPIICLIIYGMHSTVISIFAFNTAICVFFNVTVIAVSVNVDNLAEYYVIYLHILETRKKN